MPVGKYEIRISLPKMLVILLITVVPVSLAALYSITASHESYEQAVGSQFRTRAAGTANAISQFVHDRLLTVAAVSLEPAVREAIMASNRNWQGMSDPAFSERVSRIEKMWNTPAADPISAQMLSSRASQELRHYRQMDPRLLRITVTDARGVAIAATHKTLDYFQADEDFWKNIYASGRGAVNITDVLYDEVTKANYIGIGVPVTEEGTNRFIGAVDALLDITTVFPLVTQSYDMSNVRVSLVKGDGTVICARGGVTLNNNIRSDEYAAVQDLMGTLRGRTAGYSVVTLKGGGKSLVAFADTGLSREYPSLAWTILVSQDERDAMAALLTVGKMIGFMALVGLAVVTMMAAYFSLHRKPEELTHVEQLHDATHAERSMAGSAR